MSVESRPEQTVLRPVSRTRRRKAAAPSGLDGVRVLLVAFEAPAVRMISRMLAVMGVAPDRVHAVATHATAAGRLGDAGAERIDAVLTLWNDTAPEFVRSVRAGRIDVDPFLPIVAVTPARVEGKASAVAAGVHRCFSFPVPAVAVRDCLLGVVSRATPFVKTEGYFGPDRRVARPAVRQRKMATGG